MSQESIRTGRIEAVSQKAKRESSFKVLVTFHGPSVGERESQRIAMELLASRLASDKNTK